MMSGLCHSDEGLPEYPWLEMVDGAMNILISGNGQPKRKAKTRNIGEQTGHDKPEDTRSLGFKLLP